MPDQDRPRRAVPAWVTAPPEDAGPAALEAQPTSAASAPVLGAVAPVPVETPGAPVTAASTAGTPADADATTDGGAVAPAQPGAAPAAAPAATVPTGEPVATVDGAEPPLDGDVVVPDFPPDESLLPPAPTSPAVHTVPLDDAVLPPAPVSPVDLAPPAPAAPAHPVVGQPRFSVPGLEHVVVEGTAPEPSGPIGYRTPARFARQQAPLAPTPVPAAEQLPPTKAFDAIIAPPADAATPPEPTAPAPGAAPSDGAAPRLPDAQPDPEAAVTGPTAARRPALGVTPAAVLGAVAGLATLGLAAWWFTAPATVHAVGLALGVLALVLSVTTLRNAAATWQRPVALLGAVLGVVGTLVLLWAVAAALLPLVGVTLPDVTGTGTTPTVAP
jgi:hypothetical protein